MIRFEFRPLLVQGCTARVPDGCAVLIDSEQSPREQAVSVWHEVLHILLLGAGKPHDEERIEAIAQRLADACPEIVELCHAAAIAGGALIKRGMHG